MACKNCKAKKKPSKKMVKIAKGVKIPKAKEKAREKKPGQSNLGDYPNVKKSDFAGPVGTFPIDTRKRGISALKLAHNAKNPAAIRRKVYAKYPDLRPKAKT